MKMNHLKYKLLLSVTAVSILFLSGCSNERQQAQEKYREQGITAMEQADYENALKYFQKALDEAAGSITGKEMDICYYKAETLYLSGNTQDALDLYNAIIDYNHKSAKAYFLRGNLYFAMGKSEDAVNDYSMAVSLEPENYDLYIGIYECMAANGMEKEGEYYLETATKINGENKKDNIGKGRSYLLLNQPEQAKGYLEKAIEQGSLEANLYMSEVCELTGDTDAAAEYVQKYLDSGVVDSQGLYQIGKHQMDKGNYKKAVTYFEAALSLDKVPNKQIIMSKCIASYEFSGDFESAKNMMTEYLNEFPSDEAAKRENIFLQTR